MKKFNTRIDDRHFQEIHHALGCPWPDEVLGETYRNYFSVGDCTEIAARMKASPHWSGGREVFGYMSFHVTEEGRKALLDYMKSNVYIPARYGVTFRDYEGEMIVSAKSRSAAKYAAHLQLDGDESFSEFLGWVKSVKIHRKAINPHLAVQTK